VARKFTVKTDFVAGDKSSKNISRIERATKKMTKTMSRESKMAGNAYKRFSRSVATGSKRALVSMNNLSMGVGRNVKRMSDKLINFKNAAIFAGLALLVGNTIDVFASFEQANANLASVMGKTVQETVALQIDAKRLGATTAKTATEVVGLQESFARLGFAEDAIINMTESTIAGSVAMQGELADTADLVGAMIKSFDQFESINAPDVIDKMTASTQKSALNFEKLQTALPVVAGAANAAKVPFTKLLASLGKLSDAGIDASSSSTALRNIFLEAAKRGVPYEKLLLKVAKSTDKLKIANELFGKRGAVAAVTLAKQLDAVGQLDKELQNVAGTAGTTAAKQLDTLKGSLTILGSAWEGFILSLEDGTGAFGSFLKTSVRVVTEMLSIASGTAKATEALTDQELKIRRIANVLLTVVKAIGLVIAGYVAMKVAIFALNTITKVYNIGVGIQTVLLNKNKFALRGNIAALASMSVTTKIITAATKTWRIAQIAMNATMWGFPLVWIVAGIAAIIAGIVLLVKNWDKVKAAMVSFYDKIKSNPILKFLSFPLIMVVEAIKLVVKHWDKIKDAIMRVWDPIKKFFGFVIDGFMKIKDGITSFFGGGESKISASATKTIKVTPDVGSYDSTGFKSQFFVQGKTDTKMVAALEDNTKAVKDSNVDYGKWSGRFQTTIIKDANITDRSNELATKTVRNENKIIRTQREVISNKTIANSEVINQRSALGEVITPSSPTRSRQSKQKQEITINVIDKTNGKFGIQVEGTGLEVQTTGNS
jgi:hypothetical protein